MKYIRATKKIADIRSFGSGPSGVISVRRR
jgi:hypothetical protein